MPYGVKYRCTHKTETGQESVHQIEILKKDYTGGITEVLGTRSVGRHSYEKIDVKDPFANPAQKGRLALELFIDDPSSPTASYNGQAIIEEIFGSDETEYLMRRKLNGNTDWTGTVLSDLLEYDEGPFPYDGQVTAKDLTLLSGIEYPLSEGRETIIATIGSILSKLPFSLPIHSYTSWSEASINGGDDFLNQIFNDTYALRDYAGNGNEADQLITCEEVLDYILRNYGLILRQSGGRWNLYQLSALQDPSNVRRALYDSNGMQQSFDTVSLQTNVDRMVRHILPGGNNSVITPLKKATAKYEHRTQISGIQFPSTIIIDDEASKSYSQFFTSTGDQSINLSARINVDIPTQITAEFFYRIEAGGYFWDEEGQVWATGSIQNRKVLSGGDFTSGSGDYKYFGNLNIETNQIPSDADGNIVITFFKSENEPTFVSVSSFDITNLVSESGNSSSIAYELIRDGDYSKPYDHGELWFGDGPAGYSRGALTVDAGGGNLTNESWGRAGGLLNLNIYNLLLKEIMDAHRTAVRSLEGNLWGAYQVGNLISYEGNSLFFLGGELRVGNNTWAGSFLKVTISDGPEEFKTILKYDENGAAGTAGGAGAGGGGVTDHGALSGLDDPGDHPWALQADLSNVADWGPADGRFLNEASNLSEITQIAGPKSFDSGIDLNGNPIQSSGNNALEFDGLGNVTVPGNFEVLGKKLSANVDNLDVDDPIIKLADGNTTDALDIGFVGQRGSANIGFFWDESADEFAAVRTDSNAETGNINIIEHADLRARDAALRNVALAEALTLDDQTGVVSTQTFLGGFGGDGVQLKEVNGYHQLTVDDLVVRRLARFYEIVVERVRANGGTIVVSPGAEKITGTELAGDASWSWAGSVNVFAPGATNAEGVPYSWADQHECFIEEDKYITIAAGDLLWRQQWTGRGTGVTQGGVLSVVAGSATETDNSPPRSFTMWITAGSQPPQAGHEFAVIGNTTDPARQNGIIITASDTGNPYRRIYAGVDRLDKFGSQETIKGQDGRLDNIVTSNFADLDGSQTNLFGAYWDGNFYVNDGHFRGVVEVTGGNAATEDFVYDYVDSQTSGTGLQDKLDAILDNAVTNETTIIDGGFIKTSFLQLDAILVGDLADGASYETKTGAQSRVDSLQGDIDAAFDNAITNGNTIIVNGFIKTDFIDVDQLLAQDATITGSLKSENYDANNGFLLRASDGKIIANNADLRGSFTADGDVNMGGAFTYDESVGVVSLGGNSTSGGVRLEINGYTSLPGSGYIDSDGVTLSTSQGFRVGLPGTLAASDPKIGWESGDFVIEGSDVSSSDIVLDPHSIVTGSIDENDNAVSMKGRLKIESSRVYYSDDSLVRSLTAPTGSLYIDHDSSEVRIGYIEGVQDQLLLLVNESSAFGMFLIDEVAISGGNIKVQEGTNSQTIFADTSVFLHYRNGCWRPLSDAGQ